MAWLLSAAMVPFCAASLRAADTGDQNNDFYDNEPTHELPAPAIRVDGEVAEPADVDLGALPMRSVIVRETRLAENSDVEFVGAYRYYGYSLFDILREQRVEKRNRDEFPPCIDQYVVISNAKGEKVVVSWGEIFYPASLHRILIAVRVSLIVPSKTKDHWPIPTQAKIVFADDLVGVRNIDQPSVITVRSCARKFKVDRNLSPLRSPAVELWRGDVSAGKIETLDQSLPRRRCPTVFYGRGRGIHGITRFEGLLVKDVLGKPFPADRATLRQGLFTIAAADGYRIACSYSEILNRSDQVDFLLVDEGQRDGGRFKVFPAPDFFSDRAIKAVKTIHLDLIE